jgi:hypothetical protein
LPTIISLTNIFTWKKINNYLNQKIPEKEKAKKIPLIAITINFRRLTGSLYLNWKIFTAPWWWAITSYSDFMQPSFRLQSELGWFLKALFGNNTALLYCNHHCIIWTAQPIKGITTWHNPTLPPNAFQQYTKAHNIKVL